MATDRPPDGNFLGIDGKIDDFGNLHFNSAEYDGSIATYGVGCELRRGMVCPCVRIETHSARLNCPHCGGNGWLWPSDMRSNIVALVLNRRPQPRDETAGNIVTGQVQVSFTSGIVPGEGDMLLPFGEWHVVHQTLFRQALQTDNRAMHERTTSPTAIPPKIKPLVDRILYPDARIERVVWVSDGKTGALCVGREGIDFRIEEGRILWMEGRGPSPGWAYSMRYTAPAVYVLLPGEVLLREDGSDVLPYRSTGTRLDRWGYPDARDL